jgi:prepilin-type N-terminal cleavage/methylation domain-containing protein
MRRNKGFTLIELMIVVAIIAIIAAIAIPALAGARISANEGNAIATLRTVSTVCEQYHNRFGLYPTAMADLGPAPGAGLVDAQLGAGVKTGYTYTVPVVGTATVYQVLASPTTPGTSGNRWFRIDQTGVLEQAAAAGGPWTPVQ